MPTEGVTVHAEGLARLDRDLRRTGLKLSDLDFRGIAKEGMRLAAQFAPRRSGRLVQSLRASRSKNKATIRAGSAAVPYAGAINYGWRARSIEPARFMQKADRVLRRQVPRELQRQTRRILKGRGLI